MSTRSAIIAKIGDQYKGIYCHWDGGLWEQGVGDSLFHHYQDANKVEALIDLGDISKLGKEIVPTGKHSYSEPEEGVTVAYYRDRDEEREDTKALEGPTVEDVSDQIGHDGYVYVYEDGKWTVNGQDLEEALKEHGVNI